MTLVATVIVPPGDAGTPQAVGNMWQQLFSLAFSGSYTTGGEPWDPTTQFGGVVPNQVLVVDINGCAGYGYEYDKVNKKLRLYSAANTELAAGAYNASLTGDTNIVAQVLGK